MLKLLAMLTTGKLLTIFAMLLINGLRPLSAGAQVKILSPAEGDYLQGAVNISGEMIVEGFVSYEVAFAYDDDREKPAWFLIKRDINQVQKGTMAVWDTTTITDGDYKLRLLVQTDDGGQYENEIGHLHVSNYSPIMGVPLTGQTAQAVPKMVPTPPASVPIEMVLPANPAEVTRQELTDSISKGLIFVIVVFSGLGLYLVTKNSLRNK